MAGVVLAVHLASFDIGRLPIVGDVRFYLYFAWRVSEGAVPHRDFFDHKTQLATFLGALFHRLGEGLRVDPLLAIRAGYLALAGAAGLLAYAVQSRLGRGGIVAGWLGVLAYCSFGLLGLLPATGPVPKLGVALCASAAALFAHRGRWLAAGWVAALAFLDWQIGALSWVGVLAGAFLFAEPRGRALARVLLGGALGVAPFFLTFAWHGALGEALAQTVGGSLARSAGTQSRDSLGARLERIQHLIESDCPGAAWLVPLGLAGIAVALWWLVRRREQRTLLFPLTFFHGGIAAFSLLDFQWHADLFVLLHGVAFFLGLLWSALWGALASRVAARGRIALASGVLLAALLAARPGPLRPELSLETPQVSPRATLSDQREVAAELERRFAGRSVAFLESSELLYLTGRVNPLPVIFWNDASWAYMRQGEEEKDQTLRRILADSGCAAYVTAKPVTLDEFPPALERIQSQDGQYFVMLQVR